jgi:hypothetical protein
LNIFPKPVSVFLQFLFVFFFPGPVLQRIELVADSI